MLDLLIPGLLPVATAVSMPHLERWLARADIERSPERSAEAWLARRFGLEGLPVAPVALAVDEAPQPGHWVRADPVFARVERDTLVLHHPTVLAITPGEARDLVAALRDHFAPDGLEFHAPRPDRWYVRVPAGEMPLTTPLAEALGQDVFGRLPRGTGKINWAGAMTEAQMMLSTHPVNLAREARRQPPVNAIWFWGGGSLPREVPQAYKKIHAGDPFAAGLAHLSGAELSPAPSSATGLAGTGATLAVLDAPAQALEAADTEAWSRAAQALDSGWLEPLGEALARHERVRVVLPSSRDTCVATLTRAARWRIFRRARPLSAYA